MNQTVTVNISGLVFNIEVGAYDQLNNYLETIKHYFSKDEGREEIIADIESRIAELLKELVEEGKEVVTQSHVDQVIAIMGEPEAYIDEDSATEAPKQESKTHYANKKLYRDEEDNVLGGVCSGIAHYFGVDRIWFRIAFLVAFLGYGSGLLLYLILWIIIPAAKTTAEKLEMKGEPINVDSIGNAIKSEFNSFKKKVNHEKASNFGQRLVQFIYQIANFLIRVITFLLHFIVKAIAVVLMLASAILLISLLFIFTGFMGAPSNSIRIQNVQLDESLLSSYADVIFSSPTFYTLGIIGIALVLFIPVLGIFFGSLKALFNFSTNNKAIGLSAVSLWAIGVILIFVSATTTVSEFSSKQAYAQTEKLNPLPSDTLILEKWTKSNGILWENNDFYVQNDSLYMNDMTIDVIKSQSDAIELHYNFSARGSNRKEAAERAQNIQLTYKQSGNKLIVQEFIAVPVSDKYRKQNLKLSIGIPEGKSIYLDQSASSIIYDIKNVSNTYDGKMLGHHWLMTTEGLECTDCKWLKEEKETTQPNPSEDEKDSFEI